jgi:sugar lactone lactonase YvrE
MRTIPLLFVFAVSSTAFAENWQFRTLAGSTRGGGYADGPALEARFSRPSNVAVCADAIFIADGANRAVRRLSRDGEVTTIARLNYPNGIAADSQCNVIVADRDDHAIRRISAAGQVTTVATAFTAPQDVALDPDGSIWVSDNRQLRRIATNGSVTTFASLPPPTTIFPNASLGIALDASGAIYVADYVSQAIFRYARDGTRTTIATGVYVSDVAFGNDGLLYFVDYSNQLLQRVEANGALTTIAGAFARIGSRDGQGSGAMFDMPHGMALDVDGSFVVADEFGCVIRRVTASGTVTTIAGNASLPEHLDGVGTDARFVAATDVDVAADGVAYVADSTTVRRVTPDGTVTTIAGTPGDSLYRDGDRGEARFAGITGIAVEPGGTLVVLDGVGSVIRRVFPDGSVTTIAGAFNASGNQDGAGISARFTYLTAIAVAADGTIYVTDVFNHAIRKMSGNVVTTLAKGFAVPMGIDVGTDGNIYMWDENVPAIHRITPSGEVTIVARANELGTYAGGLAIASDGTIYIGGGRYHSIYRLRPGSTTIERFAGSDVALGNQNGAPEEARFRSPTRLDVAPDGRLFVKGGNREIRVASQEVPPRRRSARH